MNMWSLLPLVPCTLLALSRGGGCVSLARRQPRDTEARPTAEEYASIKALQHMYGRRRPRSEAHGHRENETVHDHPGLPGVPIINIDHDIEHHFETLLSVIHWFSGRSLPYHNDPPPYVAHLLEAARANGSEVYVSARHATSRHRRAILLRRMKEYNIRIGRHEKPDLHIITTVYPNLETFELAARHRWRNNEKELFVAHRTLLHTHGKSVEEFTRRVSGLMEEDVRLADFLDFRTWGNVLGLTPEAPHYMIPTFYPHEFTRTRASAHPTFCEAGNYYRRDWSQLAWAVSNMPADCGFTIEAAGSGSLPYDMLTSSTRRHKVVPRHHLDDEHFIEFFQRCDYILPLLGEHTDPDYLHSRLPSSVSVSLGYDIPVLAWSRVKDSYPMLAGRFYSDAQGLLDLMLDITGCASPGPARGAPQQHDSFNETPYYR